MNSEIERAFVAALLPVMDPLEVFSGLSAELVLPDIARLIVDATADNESPVSTLWRMPLNVRLDFPALQEGGNPEGDLRAAMSTLLLWFQDQSAVLAAFSSTEVALIPGWYVGHVRTRTEADRLIAELEVTIGLREI